mmetsp:Transcript_30395/g.98176  ORF Transcript_30395/g.98176 Transcript_30395/m.98176 type:complete len:214 (-) Transcript_30395:104-745(-)|eukprot:scaffold9726_cov119-Isochrysis_galbana.AAC.15
MVGVVGPHIEDRPFRSKRQPQAHIEPRVVQRGSDASQSKEYDRRRGVHPADEGGDEEQAEHVRVLAEQILYWVHVDGVERAAGRHHLPVVMLVNVAVDAAHVQHTVDERVEEIVYNKQRDERAQRCTHRQLTRRPDNVRRGEKKCQGVIYHHPRQRLVRRDVCPVECAEFIQVLTSMTQPVRASEHSRHDLLVHEEAKLHDANANAEPRRHRE